MRTSMQRPTRKYRGQHGAALLAAMLTVTLVATFAAAALWQQWRSVEVETAERARVQANWVLLGALDWARLILREDARTGGPDYLSEPWALPLKEARLSTFLATDRENTSDDNRDAFLAGQIIDLQSRLNIANLVQNGKISQVALDAFAKLFDLEGIPPAQLQALAENYRFSLDQSASNGSSGQAPIAPQRIEDLVWLGMSPAAIDTLRPFITILPNATPVNLNTASADVIYASVPGLDLSGAKGLVTARSLSPFKALADAGKILGDKGGVLSEGQQSISSRYFEVNGRLRLDQTVVVEKSVVYREGLNVVTLSRTKAIETSFPSLQ